MNSNQDRKIIYIRHGEDKRDEHKYDERLTGEGKKGVKQFTKALIEEHGMPDIIYYSPFYRTRQTKRVMLKVIKEEFGRELPTAECDYRLSRFFTKKQSKSPDIRRDTRKKGAPIYETWKEFKLRVTEQLNEVESNYDHGVIWCVTHTLVLDRIILIKGLEHEYHIPYLDTVIV